MLRATLDHGIRVGVEDGAVVWSNLLEAVRMENDELTLRRHPEEVSDEVSGRLGAQADSSPVSATRGSSTLRVTSGQA